MLSKRHQFVFVHVPKTGGGSITAELQTLYGEGEKLRTHLTAAEYRNFLGPSLFQKYHTWAVVRNPYERFISEYHWRKHWMLRKERQQAAAVSIEDLALNMERYNFCDRKHILSQYDMTHVDGKCVCEIYRYEQGLGNILKHATRQIGQGRITHDGTMSIHKHDVRIDRRPYYEQLSEAAIDALSQRYRIDFETFGYEFHKKTDRHFIRGTK